MRRAASTALLVLAFLLAPPSAAASESQVWDEDRIVRDDVVVPAGTTLVVRGASVTLANAALRIEPGGALRLESLPGRSAKITGEGDGSFVVAYGPTRRSPSTNTCEPAVTRPSPRPLSKVTLRSVASATCSRRPDV